MQPCEIKYIWPNEEGERFVRLEKPEPGHDVFSLVMSPVEWPEVHALAKFVQAGIAYDTRAAYVAQVFVFVMSQPEDILGNRNTQAAFAAVDHLAIEVPPNAAGGGVILNLPKEQMRQLLIMLGKAAESEDQADIIHDALPEKFPYRFPDIEPSSQFYAEAFTNLLKALHEDRSLNIERPPSYRAANHG
jgi:hypothetical protein